MTKILKIPKLIMSFDKNINKHEVNPFVFGKYPAVVAMFMLAKVNAEVVDLFMANKEVQKFINEDHKYDVCFIELFLIDALLGIAEKSNCIIISFTAFSVVRWTDEMTGK